MMIDLGETDIFERHVTEAGNRIVGHKVAAADFLKKLANGLGVHGV